MPPRWNEWLAVVHLPSTLFRRSFLFCFISVHLFKCSNCFWKCIILLYLFKLGSDGAATTHDVTKAHGGLIICIDFIGFLHIFASRTVLFQSSEVFAIKSKLFLQVACHIYDQEPSRTPKHKISVRNKSSSNYGKV